MFEREAERRILEAIAKGELDNYKGKGEPFPEEFWETNPFVPDDLKQAYKMLKNADMVPLEILLKRRIEEIKKKLNEVTLSASERESLRSELRDKETEFYTKMEAFRTLSRR